MEIFIAQNPGVVMAVGGAALVLAGLLLSIIGWLYQHMKQQEEKVVNKAIHSLTEALAKVDDSFSGVAREFRTWMQRIDSRMIRLETEHKIRTGSDLRLFREEAEACHQDDYPYVSK